MNPDGTKPWPNDLSPVDKVALALADVMRARAHVDSGRISVDRRINELAQAVEKLVRAARGDHT